ncbi:MAG: metalloprotease PmbA [Pseudomonadales bacterium]|nr:metalloprotease PmbA [Pseudomonadales bacterium]
MNSENTLLTLHSKQPFLQDLVNQILAEAKQQGADAAEVGANLSVGLSASVRKGEVDKVEFTQSQGFGITVYCRNRNGGKSQEGEGFSKGSASTADTSKTAIKDAVEAACSIARYTSPDRYAGLADAELMSSDNPDLDLYHPHDLNPTDAIERCLEIEKAAFAYSDLITNSEGASVSSGGGLHAYGNSHGFVEAYPSARHSAGCSVIAGEGERMQRDSWFSSEREFSCLQDAESLGRKSSERAVARLNPQTLTTRKVPVLFAAEIASSMIGHFMGAIQGGNLYRKTSYLLDSLGEAIFPSYINIYERPRIIRGIGSGTFDGDGLATYDKSFIQNGVVSHYVMGTYSARKLGMKSSANAGGVRNLFVDSTGGDFEAMLKTMDKGLLVTELMGQGVNMVTGDYSRGAEGFWVENGEIQYPVHEITIAGNLKDLYANLVAVGSDVDRRGNTQTGSLLFESMMVGGQ